MQSEDPSLQSFFSRISCSACAVTVISDTIIDIFTYFFYLLIDTCIVYLFMYWPFPCCYFSDRWPLMWRILGLSTGPTEALVHSS